MLRRHLLKAGGVAVANQGLIKSYRLALLPRQVVARVVDLEDRGIFVRWRNVVDRAGLPPGNIPKGPLRLAPRTERYQAYKRPYVVNAAHEPHLLYSTFVDRVEGEHGRRVSSRRVSDERDFFPGL